MGEPFEIHVSISLLNLWDIKAGITRCIVDNGAAVIAFPICIMKPYHKSTFSLKFNIELLNANQISSSPGSGRALPRKYSYCALYSASSLPQEADGALLGT